MNGSRFGSAIALVLVAACDFGGTTDVRVDVQFPSMGLQNTTGSLHAWILRSRETRGNCTALVSEGMDPYDVAFKRVRDDVFLLPNDSDVAFSDVPRDTVLVHVRAVDFGGITQLSGCASVKLSGAEQTVEIILSPFGAFDCEDPATEDGAPCEDGLLCTVGERCRNGECIGGRPRDCTSLSDSCNESFCEEGLGCQVAQLPDGTVCEEGLFCSSGGTCTAGVCSSTPTDCTVGVDACDVGICDEENDRCDIEPAPPLATCDDGLFCTVSDRCFLGFCRGLPRDCGAGTGCTTGACNETTDACELVNIPNGGDCVDTDPCTMNTTCTNGTCGGGVATDVDGDGFRLAGCGGNPNKQDCDDNDPNVNPDAVEGPPGSPTCSDGRDNDCDGSTDSLDSNC